MARRNYVAPRKNGTVLIDGAVGVVALLAGISQWRASTEYFYEEDTAMQKRAQAVACWCLSVNYFASAVNNGKKSVLTRGIGICSTLLTFIPANRAVLTGLTVVNSVNTTISAIYSRLG